MRWGKRHKIASAYGYATHTKPQGFIIFASRS